MKRILVIDESEVVRETLALILGREFSVVKRPLRARGGKAFADAREDVDLLIFGVTPQLGSQVAALLHLASQLPFAVLFLVDSKSVAHTIEREAEVACLAKPFDPYELHRKVGELLARRGNFPFFRPFAQESAESETPGQLDFPFLSRSTASLARRFAAARLPLMLSGEIGCGQDRVAAAMCRQGQLPGLRVAVDAAEMTEEYAARLCWQISMQDSLMAMPLTLLVHNLDRSSMASQLRLTSFLDDLASHREEIWPITIAHGDMLERVYRGDFLEPLYSKLAILTLRLAPLRERREEIPALAAWFAADFARKLHLSAPEFSEQAERCLQNYLWFGNASELESVIARTLAYHRKPLITAEDLIFDFGRDPGAPTRLDLIPAEPAAPEAQSGEPKFEIYGGSAIPVGSANGHSKAIDLNVVIHELAHELKNPMVTIKTFAQLLGERYQDENFRSRFQEVVGSDIERMDELLEVMIEFADFPRPHFSRVPLAEKVQTMLDQMQSESAKRKTRFAWKGNETAGDIRADEAQLEYILKNVLLVIFSEARSGSEIEVDVSRKCMLALSYFREGDRMASIAHYLEEQKHGSAEAIFPLRVLLAKHLLERTGGRLTVASGEGARETMILEFSSAEHLNEE